MKTSVFCSSFRKVLCPSHKSIHTTPSFNSMKAWQAYKYGGPEVLELSTLSRIPPLQRPTDVLVKVQAASINPIDVRMLGGYGKSVVNALKCADTFPDKSEDFPMILGRDFVGEVIDFGRQVKGFKVGDKVWGALSFAREGCLAEYVSACSSTISRCPQSLSSEESASLPFVALTVRAAWTSAQTFAPVHGFKRALVLGGAGGVGSFAVQYLKHLGLEVTTTCSGDAESLMYELGSDAVVDYKQEGFMDKLLELKDFDFILDAAGVGTNQSYLSLLKPNFTSKYVTLTSPLVRDTDNFGLLAGTALSASKALQDTLMGLKQNRSIHWAYFSPNGEFLKDLAVQVDKGKIKAVIDCIFKFEDIKEAFTFVSSGNARGKTVVLFPNEKDI